MEAQFVVKTGRGYHCVLDIEDEKTWDKFPWQYNKTTQEFMFQRGSALLGFTRYKLSRFLLGVNNPDECVDHINGDRFDNRKCNLRICTKAENNRNKVKTQNKTTSKYKGVYWERSCNRWRVQMEKNGRRYNVGVFKDEVEAAKAYDKKALELYGEFACLNFPTDSKKGALI